MDVAGVDGCKAGWLVVLVGETSRLRIVNISIATTFEELIARTDACAAVAVDIPIGLSNGPERQADQRARTFLKEPRARSVFRAPCWPVLNNTTDESRYRDVCRISREYCLQKDGQPAAVSQQAWRIMPKVREANLAMTPALQESIFEVHPEVSFCALNGLLNNGGALKLRKARVAGRNERLDLLRGTFAGDLEQTFHDYRLLLPRDKRRKVAWDDFLDACAAAWTASRIAAGTAQHLPDKPEFDARGLQMEIVY